MRPLTVFVCLVAWLALAACGGQPAPVESAPPAESAAVEAEPVTETASQAVESEAVAEPAASADLTALKQAA
ncbi:MAG TPA: hypothetical protein PKD98_25605, partial [Anaerolineae bacterium]|nr:hypothetical protein [Anaerolineae bacterium]